MSSQIENRFKTDTYLFNSTFVDDLYESFLEDPSQISEQWQAYFAQLQRESPASRSEVAHTPIQAHFLNYKPAHGLFVTRDESLKDNAALAEFAKKQASVLRVINGHRYRGHQRAHLDPLQLQPRPHVEDLDLETHGLTEADLHIAFNPGSLKGVPHEMTLADILTHLKKIYCDTIGAEYMHITDTKQKRWIQERFENLSKRPKFDEARKKRLLDGLTAAQGLEDYLHAKYVGQKRFSLEGGDTLIPLLDEIIQHAGQAGVEEIVLGMAHRGRLNVLVNILGKRPKDLFSEFEGKKSAIFGSGDVKYHQGFACDVTTPGGAVHLALAFNPSHLEIVNPVVEGAVRARQERRDDKKRDLVVPVLIHGDAAFAGQGVIMETLNLSETRGYSTGGTIHVVINNQIGFTTSDPLDSRSTLYCTDVAKIVQAPIFHVNGDDPEAVLFVTQLAVDYRMQFHRDVVIDMVCYRRLGHNEADEPAATQPVMYQKIGKHPKVQAIYAQKLAQEGLVAADAGEKALQNYRSALETKDTVIPHEVAPKFEHGVNWKQYAGRHWTEAGMTQIDQDRLQNTIESFTRIPEGFTLDRSVSKIVQARRQMAKGELPLDWGCAESLAFATLLEDGYPIRLSGQDSGRGTFAHRHAVLHEKNTGEMYIPLQHLSDKQQKFLVINSLLSEEAVLGFEFGYSASEPETLTIWEAQFGDFANGAQVVIDQFISSSESKWQRFSGLIMLLPHGYDGQGPEHSSARLERYLQLCAEDNIQVCCPSTPAQCFHMIRRQMIRPYRKPLIVMSPKSLLRHKRCVSTIENITHGSFQTVIDEVDPNITPDKVNRLIFCTGKVYYDLVEAREEHKLNNVAIVRLEQLYPYPKEEVAKVLERYDHVEHRLWVQEEPRNQGAWWYMRAHMDVNLSHTSRRVEYAGRPSSASPAVGYLHAHRRQLQEFIAEALNLPAVIRP
jgi:2-oxoglutarate dehydrogenase E1 component